MTKPNKANIENALNAIDKVGRFRRAEDIEDITGNRDRCEQLLIAYRASQNLVKRTEKEKQLLQSQLSSRKIPSEIKILCYFFALTFYTLIALVVVQLISSQILEVFIDIIPWVLVSIILAVIVFLRPEIFTNIASTVASLRSGTDSKSVEAKD